jgi:thiamine biosynthesis lipoprotein
MDGWSHGISGSVVHVDRVVHVEHVWNTAVSITVAGTQGRAEDALQALRWCSEFFLVVDRTFSTYRPETEASFYRNGLDWRGGASPTFASVLDACARLRDATSGSFDPWAVPGGFDPSGYVKGWAAGLASEHLCTQGLTDHLINAGGDVCASGDEAPGSGHGWPVGIANPFDPQEVIAVVHLRDAAMATSGRYLRGDHVIDPHTGEAAVRVDSATVIGPDPGSADAFASAALVDGTDSMRWFADLGDDWSLHLVVGDRAFTHGIAFRDRAAPPTRTDG